eukprot:1141011-Pelagomonas_calceolata.AAC.3
MQLKDAQISFKTTQEVARAAEDNMFSSCNSTEPHKSQRDTLGTWRGMPKAVLEGMVGSHIKKLNVSASSGLD